MVVSRTLILRRFFLAASMPFLIAAGTSLALPVPKPTTLAPGVADHHQSREAHVLAALDDLGDAVDRDDLFLQVQVLGSIRFAGVVAIRLELQSCFTGRIGQRLHAAVIQISAAVEHHLLDALFLGALGQQLADFLGAGDVAAVRRRSFSRSRRPPPGCRPAGRRSPGRRLLEAAEHRQARPLRACRATVRGCACECAGGFHLSNAS